MLAEVCIGENICNFGEGSSGADLNCAVASLPVSEQAPEPFYMRDNDSSKSVDAQDLPGADVREGSFGSVDTEELSGADFREGSPAIGIKPTVEIISVTQRLSDTSCTENNELFKSVDAQHLDGADFREGSSTIDIKPTDERVSVIQQLSDPSCTENDDFSKSVDTEELPEADFQEGSSGINSNPTVERISVTQQLSNTSSTDNDDFSKSVDAQHLAGADFREGSSAIDIKPTVEKVSATQQLSDPSCTENDDFSESIDAPHLAKADFWEQSSAIDIKPTFEIISVTQQLSDPSCTENNDMCKILDAQDLSGADSREGSSAIDIKSTVDRLSVSEQVSDPSCTEHDDMSKTVNAQDLSGSDFREGSSPMNLNSTADISTATGQLSEPSCTKNNDSKSVDAPDLSRADFGEQLSTMDLHFTIEKLSVSPQMLEPSCVRDDDFTESMGAHSGGDVLVAPFDSINVCGPFEQSDNGGKSTIKVDGASEANLPDSMCVPPWKRCLRNTRARQNAQIAKPARNRRNLTNRKASLDLDSLQITRKTRSFSGKRARSSVWGLLTDVQVFEQNGGIDVNLNDHKKPSRARGGQARGKREKNQSQTCSKKSKRKSCGITGRITLKVKVGEEVVPSPIIDTSSTDNHLERHSETTEKFSNLSKEEELPRSMGFQGLKENMDTTVTCSDDSMLDFHLADKDLVENLTDKPFDDLKQFPSGKEVDKLGSSNDSRDLDPGTSPDSEVINLNVDASYVGKGLEDLPDILSSSKACVASEDVSSFSPMQKSIKKGKKKKKMVQAGDCSPKDEPLNSEITDIVHQLGEIEQEKTGDISYSAEASASATTANASGNTSSTEGMSKEQLFSRVADFGMTSVTGKADNSREINISSSIGNELESSESQMSNKVFPRSKGRKISKSAKTEGMRNSNSEIPASANKRGSTSRKKGSQDKPISKLKLKEKVIVGRTSGEVEGQALTGNLKLSDVGESGTGISSSTGDISTLEIEPRGVMEQYAKPRNAWVLCDDCHKWRRIPAILADQIEDTNCRWTCKDNTDKNFADCSVPQEKSNAEINVELEISDASCDEDACDARWNSNQSRKNQSTGAQQSTWRLIKSNLFLHRSRKTQTIDEIMVCHCKPPSDGRMGCGGKCLNRMLNIECVKGTCPCSELCSNQQFQKRKYAKLKCFRCGKKGYGLQVLEDISEGQFLIEYVGEVLDMHAYEARQRDYALKGHKHFYFMTLNGSEVIDACAKGNLGRFINHSCDPNCRTEKWMVNGEVCIGLFALRDIKKGEEVTFDYNYVRVFGAAAKKCVCGSPQCRGYIGGDPQNAEVIVQDDSDDEYPEPVMVCEDGVVDENLNDKMSVRSSFDCMESRTAKEPPEDMDKLNESEHIVKDLEIATEVQSHETEVPEDVEADKSATVVGHVDVIEASGNSLNRSLSAAPKVDVSVEMEESIGSLVRLETALNPDDLSSENTMIGEQECTVSERSMKRSSCSTAGLEENSPSTLSKLLPDVMESKRKLKSSKSHPLMKTSRSSSSVKKEKPKSFSVIGKKLEEMPSKYDVLSCKSKKIVEGLSSGRFEAVQEKLNELLDHDGGISKRRDASRGYLKLLLLTAASGDSGDGETIQSNRDLSMILDALLKTKSRTVLVDVINKNGLQMLHNMLKRYRKEFKKIPILRKLLKVFEYLATREILTSEQINGGPPCPGVESFRESILSLTEHIDKQVHQIARSFRDRWIPRHARKNSCMDWEDSKMDSHRGLDYSRFPTHNRWSDRSGRRSETPDCITQSIGTSSTVDTGNIDGSCPSSSSGSRTRKRKSRWDQPEDTDPRVETNMAGDGSHNIDDDVPPGFAAPLNVSVVPSEVSPKARSVHPKISSDMKLGHETVLGHPQQRFISRLSVSYGVPLCIVQQVGTPQPGRLEGWSVAPGMPFNPFPPLPPYPRDKRDPLSNAADSAVMGQPARVAEQDHNQSACHHSGVNSTSSSRASLQDVEMLGEKNKLNFQQSRGPNTLGRKYFRQQKWNGSKLGPPWIRNRNNWGFMGNNSRNGMYNVGFGNGTSEFRSSHGLEKVNGEMDISAYHHHQPQQY